MSEVLVKRRAINPGENRLLENRILEHNCFSSCYGDYKHSARQSLLKYQERDNE